MPAISRFYCDNPSCGFDGPEGWGYYMYVVADDGERIRCPHPGEMRKARAVVGEDASDEEVRERMGFSYHTVCVDCTARFDLDPERDVLRCPECRSSAVELLVELVGYPCPQCGEGTFTAEDTGAIA